MGIRQDQTPVLYTEHCYIAIAIIWHENASDRWSRGKSEEQTDLDQAPFGLQDSNSADEVNVASSLLPNALSRLLWSSLLFLLRLTPCKAKQSKRKIGMKWTHCMYKHMVSKMLWNDETKRAGGREVTVGRNCSDVNSLNRNSKTNLQMADWLLG